MNSNLSSRRFGAVVLFLCVVALAALSIRPTRVAGHSEPADLVLVNGVLYTVDAARPLVEAVAIKGERIVAVGTSREIQAWVGKDTRVIDLKGRFALPGFNDAHIHFAGGGQAKLAIEFGGSMSLAELRQRIRTRLGEYRPGEWITGRGWDHTLLPEKRFPRREDLDAAARAS